MSDALKPCPFCGEPLVETIDDGGHFWSHPGRAGFKRSDCWLCDVIVENTPDEVIAWNRRALALPSPAFDPANIPRLKAERAELVKSGGSQQRIVDEGGEPFAGLLAGIDLDQGVIEMGQPCGALTLELALDDGHALAGHGAHLAE